MTQRKAERWFCVGRLYRLQPSVGLSWSVIDRPSDTSLEKNILSISSRNHFQIASLLELSTYFLFSVVEFNLQVFRRLPQPLWMSFLVGAASWEPSIPSGLYIILPLFCIYEL